MVGGSGPIRGSVRWAFNTKTWEPTEQEWLLASRCITLEDKERIQKFVFKTDAKASMAGSLMMRRLAHLATGEPYDKIRIVRDKYGRPTIENQNVVVDFNVSHQGSYTVLAGEVDNDFVVGVDVMSLQRRTGHELSEFFRLMNKTCSLDEWNTILAPSSEDKRSSLFFRHWSLKESYLKGLGVGVRTDMRHISFKLNTLALSINAATTDTVLEIDRIREKAWVFHEWLLDPQHCVSVALSSRSKSPPSVPPVPFTVLSWSDLIQDATPLLSPDFAGQAYTNRHRID